MSDDELLPKPELLAAMRASRRRLDALLAGIDDARWLESGVVAEGHSVKDLVAHITTWEERLLRWIARWRETGKPVRPEPGRGWDEIDAINDEDFASRRDLSLADVRAAGAHAYARTVTEVERLTPSEIIEPSPAWDGLALSWIIRANTDQHYDEHREHIEAWLARCGAS